MYRDLFPPLYRFILPATGVFRFMFKSIHSVKGPSNQPLYDGATLKHNSEKKKIMIGWLNRISNLFSTLIQSRLFLSLSFFLSLFSPAHTHVGTYYSNNDIHILIFILINCMGRFIANHRNHFCISPKMSHVLCITSMGILYVSLCTANISWYIDLFPPQQRTKQIVLLFNKRQFFVFNVFCEQRLH